MKVNKAENLKQGHLLKIIKQRQNDLKAHGFIPKISHFDLFY